MKFFATAAILSLATAVLANPVELEARKPADLMVREAMELMKRSSCQFCDIGIGPFKLDAGDACCSAHCIAQSHKPHGGHCNENKVCVCNN